MFILKRRVGFLEKPVARASMDLDGDVKNDYPPIPTTWLQEQNVMIDLDPESAEHEATQHVSTQHVDTAAPQVVEPIASASQEEVTSTPPDDDQVMKILEESLMGNDRHQENADTHVDGADTLKSIGLSSLSIPDLGNDNNVYIERLWNSFFGGIRKPTSQSEAREAGLQGDEAAAKVFEMLGGELPKGEKGDGKGETRSMLDLAAEEQSHMPPNLKELYAAWQAGTIPVTGVLGSMWHRAKKGDPKLKRKADKAPQRSSASVNLKLKWTKDVIEDWVKDQRKTHEVTEYSTDDRQGKYVSFSKGVMDEGGDQCAFATMTRVAKNCFKWYGEGKRFGPQKKPFVKWCGQREAIQLFLLEESASMGSTDRWVDKESYRKKGKQLPKSSDESEDEEEDDETEEDAKTRGKKKSAQKKHKKDPKDTKPKPRVRSAAEIELATAISDAKKISKEVKTVLQNASDLLDNASELALEKFNTDSMLRKVRAYRNELNDLRKDNYFSYLGVEGQTISSQKGKFSANTVLKAVEDNSIGNKMTLAAKNLSKEISKIISMHDAEQKA